jgi:hypothetical protein
MDALIVAELGCAHLDRRVAKLLITNREASSSLMVTTNLLFREVDGHR